MTNASLPTRRLPLAIPLAAIALALLGACASTPPPSAELAVGRTAVERASSTAAADAPVELAAARDKIARANAAFGQKEYELARRLATEAEADATLAEAQARSARSERALVEVREGLRALRDEMARQ